MALLTGTVWADTVWIDVWDGIWGAPGDPIVSIAPIGLSSPITSTKGVTSPIKATVGRTSTIASTKGVGSTV